MIQELLEDNEKIIEILNGTFASADNENRQGIADFIAGRIEAHQKHAWMLRSFLKEDRA